MDHDFRVNIRPIIPSLPASSGHSKDYFQEIYLFFLLAKLAFYNFLPKKTYYLLNGTSIQGIGWASVAVRLPSARLTTFEQELPTAIGSIIKKNQINRRYFSQEVP
jgi:hypothetical protein